MCKIVSAALVAAGLLGVTTVASATPAEFGVGIYFGSTAPLHPAPAPVVVHEQPVYVAPAHAAPVYVAPEHAAPVHSPRAPAHYAQRAPWRHGVHDDGYRRRQH